MCIKMSIFKRNSAKDEAIKAAIGLEKVETNPMVTVYRWDCSELKKAIEELRREVSKLREEHEDGSFALAAALNDLNGRVKVLESDVDDDTVYDDTKLWKEVSLLSDRIKQLEGVDFSYDDTELRKMIADSRLHGLVDLTDVFKTGNSEEINKAIGDNKTNVIYVGPGDYNVDGTIMLSSVAGFYCFGNIVGPLDVTKLKPMSEYWPGTLYRNDVMRSVVTYCGSNGTVYINKITVRHNYCGFYVYFSKASTITINTIAGKYTTTAKSEYKSVFNSGVAFTSKSTRYKPITDDWKLNAGFMTDHLADATVNLGFIENLNYGIYFIETIPDKVPDPSRWSAINFNYIEIMCNKFNVNSIVCKKAVTFDFDNAIEWDGDNTVYVTTHSRGGNNIHGNVFNINGFDATGGKNTNSIETMNPDYYDQSKDNRRIMFNIIGKSNDSGCEFLSNNSFTASYYQGIYDVVVNAKNVSCLTWNGYLQVNDVYFNDGTSHSQRNKIASSYKKGTSSGYDAAKSITISPVLIFDNCYNMKFNNTERAFIRPNEISVTNSKNIYIGQVDVNDSGDFYHRVLKTNYNKIQQRIYDGSDVYVRLWNDGFTKV